MVHCLNLIKLLCGVAPIVAIGTLELRHQRFVRHVCILRVILSVKVLLHVVIQTRAFVNTQTKINVSPTKNTAKAVFFYFAKITKLESFLFGAKTVKPELFLRLLDLRLTVFCSGLGGFFISNSSNTAFNLRNELF